MSSVSTSSTAPSTQTRASYAPNAYWAASRRRLFGYSRYVHSHAHRHRRHLTRPPPTQLFGGSEDAYVREVSFVDPASRDMTITSVNLSLSQFATCLERIRYQPSYANPDLQTRFTQTAEIQSRMNLWRSVSDRLEGFLAERFEQNAQQGKLGFTDVLRSLWEGEKQHPHIHEH